jgi:hypothetical protein
MVPDAGVIVTHRDPLEVVASLASLHTTLRRTFSDTVDPVAIGAESTRRWAEGLRRARQARDAGCAPPDRFLDVQYTDLVRDPIVTVRMVYRHFEIPWHDAAEAHMRRFLADNPRTGTEHIGTRSSSSGWTLRRKPSGTGRTGAESSPGSRPGCSPEIRRRRCRWPAR